MSTETAETAGIQIELVPMTALRAYVRAALNEQSYTDSRGVLGVPTSPNGELWDLNWDVTAIRELVDTAVVMRWSAGDLEVESRCSYSRHFRLYRPSTGADVEVQAVDHSVWDVTAPDGHLIVRAGIEWADLIYRDFAPAGSHLHRADVRVDVRAGVAA